MTMTMTPASRQIVVDNTTYNCSLRLNCDNTAAIANDTVQLNDGDWSRMGAGYGNGGYAEYGQSVDFGSVTDTVTIASYDLMAYFDAQDGNGYQLQPVLSGTYDPPLTFSAGDQLVIPEPALIIDWQ